MSDTDECYTPARYLQKARDVLGCIDLDPASNEQAQELVRALRYYTKEDDGLAQAWIGRVWMNCPYSRPAPWAAKLLAAYAAGEVSAALSLFNSRTGSKWFDAMAAVGWRCEVRKRIRFWGPGTKAGQTGMQDQVFFYLGSNPARFAAVFAELGRIVPPSVTLAVTPGGKGCLVCSRSLAGQRADAEVCSRRCNQKRYRLRQKETA